MYMNISAMYLIKLRSILANLTNVHPLFIYRRGYPVLSSTPDFFKDLLNGDKLNETIDEAHANFVRLAIAHFKRVDIEEILQKEYIGAQDADTAFAVGQDTAFAVGQDTHVHDGRRVL